MDFKKLCGFTYVFVILALVCQAEANPKKYDAKDER